MITRENYLQKIKEIDFRKVGNELKKAKSYFDKITKKGTHWTELDSNPSNAKMVDLYFKSLEVEIKENRTVKTQKDIKTKSIPFKFQKNKAPQNLSQFKKSLKVNIGSALYVQSEWHGKDKIEVRKKIATLTHVQSNSFSTSEKDKKAVWMDFGTAKYWKFFDSYAYFREGQLKLWYYYKKPRGFKEGLEVINPTTNKVKATKRVKGKSNDTRFSKTEAKELFDDFVEHNVNEIAELWINPALDSTLGLREFKSQMIKLGKSKPYESLEKFQSFIDKVQELHDFLFKYMHEEEEPHRMSDWADFVGSFKFHIMEAKKLIPKKTKPSPKTPKITKPKKKTARQLAYEKANKVEKISEELRFIKRFVLMHDKIKTQNQIRLFINALQKAIIEKRIRKTSPYAKEITYIQDYLLNLFTKFKKENEKIQIDLDESLRSNYLTLVGKQAELYSVRFIKSYINLQGRLIPNQKAKNLHNRIANAINSGKLTKKDRYWNEIEKILERLKRFVKNTLEGELTVSRKVLNGLTGIVQGVNHNYSKLNQNNPVPKNTIMKSTDVVNLDFQKLDFKGKWRRLIGNPSAGFRTMIFGKPKMGKSYLAVYFAGYLARNHGTVLYVAKEEGIDDTLKQKLKDKNVAHPDLDVSNYLPDDLSAYDFVFLDSVNKLALTPEDLDRLNQTYPYTSMIEIFQTTKQGNFRGGNEFQHDVDVVIEVPEKGKAVQFGRFNQGGEMDIFRSVA